MSLAEGDACCGTCRQLVPNLAKYEDKFRGSVVVQDDGCHVWIGNINRRSGYGVLALGSSKKMNAHRYAWVLKYGEPPPGLVVCHRCDVRACVNIEHLFLATQAQNLADMRAKGRHPHGDLHWTRRSPEKMAALSESRASVPSELARTIRERYAVGDVSQQRLADELGVGRSLVLAVVSGKTWKHVGGLKADGMALHRARVEARRSQPCLDCQRPSNWNGKTPTGGRCSSCYTKVRYRAARSS